jgi:hypothetical protein
MVAPIMFPRLALLLLVSCQPLVTVASADINAADKKEKGPPGAPAIVPMTVHAVRGQPLEIKLAGMTRKGGIKFIIKSLPKLGTLKEAQPVQKGDLASVVTYTASMDATGDTDVFTYSAQATDTSTAEPEKVTIRISNSAARLEVQEIADAGRVVMGHPKEIALKIRNAGNAAWVRKVAAPKGWRWVKPAEGDFNLAAGTIGDFEIQCEALSPVTLDETITLQGDKKTRFRALIVAPFSAPARVALKWNGENRTRTGAVEIENYDREAAITVRVSGPVWLKFPEELKLEPDAKRELPVSISGHFDQEFSGVLKLTSGASSQDVQVKAGPSPALLRVVSGATEEGEVAFGKLDAETIKTASRDVVLRNEGGRATLVISGELKAFRLQSPPQAGKGIELAPGGEITLIILPPIDTAGTNREKFILGDGESHVELLLTAEIPASAIPATPGAIAGQELIKDPPKQPVVVRQARSKSEIIKNAIINIEGLFLSDGKEDRTIPVVNVVQPEIQTGDTITFTWDLPPGEGWTFRLCYTQVERAKAGGFVKVRRPCGDEVKYSIKGRKASATVSGMQPEVWYGYSVQTIAPNGRYSLPGREFRTQLSTPMPSHWEMYWEWYVAGAVITFALGYWLRKKWKEPISAMAT